MLECLVASYHQDIIRLAGRGKMSDIGAAE